MITQRAHSRTVRSATSAAEGAGGNCKYPGARTWLWSVGRLLPLAAAALTLLLATGCAHLAIDKHSTWTGPLPQPVTVKEAARIEPPWYGKVVAPFVITLFSGSRVGMEYNEGRIVRTTEYIRGIPYAGWSATWWANTDGIAAIGKCSANCSPADSSTPKARISPA